MKEPTFTTMKELEEEFADDPGMLELIHAAENGELLPAPNQEEIKKELQRMAKRYSQKNARINVRLSEADLRMLKSRAVEEGLPYQTLISSILHKYVTGRLTSTV